MSDAPTEALTKEVGAGKFKLPLWQWGAVIVVGVFIARKSGSLFGGASTTPAPDTTAADAAAAALQAGFGDNGAVEVPVAGGGFNSGQSQTIADNDAWRLAADNYLTSVGNDALKAARAIDKYLNGDALTPNEQIMVESALRRLGPTPTPVPTPIPIPPTPKPPPKPKPPPAKPPTKEPIQQQTPLHTTQLKPGHNAFEIFVAFCNMQNGAGTWWLTNLGGVYTAGKGPYLGSPLGSGEHRNNWSRIASRYPAAGYTCITSDGYTRSYGG